MVLEIKCSCQDYAFTLTSIVRNILAQKKERFACFIDMQNAFDCVDRDLLFYKLLDMNIDENIYHCIKALYSKPIACVKINNYVTYWFDSGVCQGDSLSPMLFGIFINDLELNELNLGIPVNKIVLSMLLFADDIVILRENHQDLQNMSE